MKHPRTSIKLISAAAMLALAVAIGPFTTGVAHASWGVNNQHQLVPLYVYPDWWNTGNAWSYVCSHSNASGIGSTVIANAKNGPTTSRNTDYAQAMEICHDGGHNVIGYVDTSYGAVPLATVEANINAWYSQYNGDNTGVYDLGTTGMDTHIDGIFIDQVNNFPTSTVTSGDNISVASYYKQIYNYIQSIAPSNYNDVVANAGAPASTDWQLNDTGTNPTQIADELVVFEGTEADLGNYSGPSWISNYPASDIGMLVYNTPSADIGTVCTALKSAHAGLVDVTDATIQTSPPATPWNFLQSDTYWSSFRASCG